MNLMQVQHELVYFNVFTHICFPFYFIAIGEATVILKISHFSFIGEGDIQFIKGIIHPNM